MPSSRCRLASAPLDPRLLPPEPVQRPIDLALRHAAELEHRAQAGRRRVGGQGAHGGELGAGRDDPVDDHRQSEVTRARRGSAATPEQQARQVELARQAEHEGDMAVGQRAQHGQLAHRCRLHGGAALEQRAQAFDQFGRPAGQIGQGALLGAASLAVALAQQHRGRRVAVRHRLDVHGRIKPRHASQYKPIMSILHGYTGPIE